MPVTIGVFHQSRKTFPAEQSGQQARQNRSFEYEFPRRPLTRKFLLQEYSAGSHKKYKPHQRPRKAAALGGASSGGILRLHRGVGAAG